jgi:hypothetical protein
LLGMLVTAVDAREALLINERVKPDVKEVDV